MRGHHLRLLEHPAVCEINRNPGRPEGVAADLCLNPGRLRPPLNHVECIGAGQRPLGELPRPPDGTPEQRPFLVLSDPSRPDVAVEILLERMVRRHLVIFPALLVEPEPPALALGEVVLDPHGQRRADPREAVNKDGEERPVTKSDQRIRGDALEQRVRFLGHQHRRLTPLDHVLRTPHHRGRVRLQPPGRRPASRTASAPPPGAA